LSEGFATYAEWLWSDHIGERTVETNAFLATQLRAAGLPPPGSPPPEDLFNGSVYLGGALVLYQLRKEIGDQDFFATLRTYAADYAGRNASSEDFIALAERVSGQQLDHFFDTWLYGD
jgi:aminopeptidase N